MFVRAYLRASTREQDANRACQALKDFALGHGLTIAAKYVENESGAKLARHPSWFACSLMPSLAMSYLSSRLRSSASITPLQSPGSKAHAPHIRPSRAPTTVLDSSRQHVIRQIKDGPEQDSEYRAGADPATLVTRKTARLAILPFGYCDQ